MNVTNNGDRNVGIVARDIRHSIIHFGEQPQEKLVVTVRRTRIVATPLRPAWMTALGALGVVLSVAGSIASIVSVFGKPLSGFAAFAVSAFDWTFPMFVAGIAVVALGTRLGGVGFVHLGPVTLESDDGGPVHMTGVTADPCPLCAGRTTMRQEGGTYVFACTRNPNHRWLFDHTVLPPVGDDREAAR